MPREYCAVHTGEKLQEQSEKTEQKITVTIPRFMTFGGKERKHEKTVTVVTEIKFRQCPHCGLIYDLKIEKPKEGELKMRLG